MNGRSTMKSLSKKSRIKGIKQQLCDRINQCKSLKELEGWKRTFSYHPVLKDDQDWDEGFFFDLIEFKLKRMSEYFHTHHIVENSELYGHICDKAIAILNAGYKTDIVLDKDLKNYVNIKNEKRFFNKHEKSFIEKFPIYHKATLRELKAKALFWRYLEHHIEELWD